MIGMDFVSFVILLVIGLAVAAVFHFVLSYRVIPGWGSYFGKVVLGWIGAWLGSPVLGYWWKPLRYENVYIIPAILGCAALIVLFQTVVAKKSS
jgi:uncharacterized membrane protein YeaQ/YmgE (transglycosylase-associated protein family)